ncbi:MAG: MoxR family ATPase [Leptospiraceae bacterium]|nr:MoxR family ATPase [Leptospiraceae bacterium]
MQTEVSIEEVESANSKLEEVLAEIRKEVTGQDTVVKKILISLISGGHVLLEGMPGLAKTLLAKTIARAIELPFKRIQFTPDLLPADLVGTVIFNPKKAEFDIRKGPVFTGVLLADEINRAPAKVQSALLQCMEERQVTIGDTTFKLDEPFLVIATENPIEQEGTYQLPEAQMDRFLMKIDIGYPSLQEEMTILASHGSSEKKDKVINKVINGKELTSISRLADNIYVDVKLQEYIVKLVRNTRPEQTLAKDVKLYLKHGASPRACLALIRAARATALLSGRTYVVPEDILFSVQEILNHRIILSFEALSEDISLESLLAAIKESTPLP